MRKTQLAFIGFVFVVYWLYSTGVTTDQPASLQPSIASDLMALSAPTVKRLGAWLTHEATKLKRAENSPETAIRLKRKALGLSATDLEALRVVALDSTAASEQRLLAVYMIGLSESAAARLELRHIGQATLSTPATALGYSDEITVRTQALEALLKRLNPEDATRFLNDTLKKITDPALVQRAQYWLKRL